MDDSPSHLLDRCTRSLARAPGHPAKLVPWAEFCRPDSQLLAGNASEWQRLGGFHHHRAATVLVAFRASWLALCATVPEHHLGLPIPSLTTARAALDDRGMLQGLVLGRSGPGDDWWTAVSDFLSPLTEGLAALGGPPPESDQYWGNAVGLIGEVLRRMAADGAGGNVLDTALELRNATGREDLLDLRAAPQGLHSRRRTCCQLWRANAGTCTECVLHDAPRSRRNRRAPGHSEADQS